MSNMMKRLTDRPNILDKIETIVKENVASGTIPADAKLVGIGTLDSEGIKIVGMVEMLDPEKHPKSSLKIKAIFEHDWDGDDTIAGNVIFAKR